MRNWAEWWPVFFYRFVHPELRINERANYADRMKRVIALDNPSLLGADETLFLKALAYHERDLEEELGAALIDRTQRQIRLTPEGELFLEGARATLDAAESAVESWLPPMEALTPQPRGAVRTSIWGTAQNGATRPSMAAAMMLVMAAAVAMFISSFS